MNIDIFSLITNINPWLIVKIAALILLLLYTFFALILFRQVTLMNQILEAKFSPVIKLIALVHLIWVVFLFLITLLFL